MYPNNALSTDLYACFIPLGLPLAIQVCILVDLEALVIQLPIRRQHPRYRHHGTPTRSLVASIMALQSRPEPMMLLQGQGYANSV